MVHPTSKLLLLFLIFLKQSISQRLQKELGNLSTLSASLPPKGRGKHLFNLLVRASISKLLTDWRWLGCEGATLVPAPEGSHIPCAWVYSIFCVLFLSNISAIL